MKGIWKDKTLERQILPQSTREMSRDQWGSSEGRNASYGAFIEEWEIPTELQEIYNLEHALLPIIGRMEFYGIGVDTEKWGELEILLQEKIVHLQTEIRELVGDKWNFSSPKQLQELLFGVLQLPKGKKTKTGFSVDTEVLESLKTLHPIAGLLLDLRGLEKILSTYLIGFRKYIDSNEIIHPSFTSTSTTTGRMSCEHPNMQNIPTKEGYGREIKSCFTARSKNHALVVADYSQIELRVLAHLSGDPTLQNVFIHGGDIHEQTARYLFPESPQISADQRRKAKSINFGIIYGISSFGLSRALQIPLSEAREYRERFFQLYPKVQEYYTQLLEGASKTSQVRTAFGRIRSIPNLISKNIPLRLAAEREAMNMPIQGTAADILKFAMRDLAEKFSSFHQAEILLQVHDELVIECLQEDVEVVSGIVREVMEGIWPECSVPLLVSVSHGYRWTEAK